MNKAKRRPAKRAATKQVALANALRERDEALAFQAATDEILAVIARSSADAGPVFDAIVRSALKIFGGMGVGIALVEGGALVNVAEGGNLKRRPGGFRMPLSRESTAGLAVLEKRVVAVSDTEAPRAPRYAREHARAAGVRSVAAAPMLGGKNSIGAIVVLRKAPGPWSKRHLEVLSSFAAQAVIAIENARLFNETREALERQTATAGILHVIASSPSDTQPVFDAIARNAKQLFGALYANVVRLVGDELHLAAHTGSSAAGDEALRKLFPTKVTGQGALGKAILSRAPVVVTDVEADPAYSEQFRAGARKRGYRSLLTVPMLREGKAIGTIAVTRRAPGPFTDHEISVLQTFADQAVIAIENARLFNDLSQRNDELKQSVDSQQATSEILASISTSVTDARPVFDTIVSNVLRLFGTRYAAVFGVRGEELHLLASKGDASLEKHRAGAFRKFRAAFPQRIDWNGFTGKALRAGKVSQIAPIVGNPEATPQAVRLAKDFGYDAMLLAPLMKDGKAIGAIGTTRPEAEPFDARQLALFEAFSSQAVIAIENARLFNETKEALEQQTATGDILRVIAGSPSEVQPVFDEIVHSALRLIGGTTAHVTRLDGNVLNLAAFSASDDGGEAALKALYPMRVEDTPLAEVLASGAPLIVADAEKDPRIAEPVRAAMRARGVRGVVVVPMMRNAEAIGTLVVNRAREGQFSDRDIRLLKSFADQAVIAIENARLFNETKEALEHLKATSGILGIIASSIQDAGPVFDAIATSASAVIENARVQIFLLGGGKLHHAGGTGLSEEQKERIKRLFPVPLDRSTYAGCAMLERRVIHVPDVLADRDRPEVNSAVTASTGLRAILAVPMLHRGEAIGCITTSFVQPAPFSDRQIALLKSFADQAVIAIENARLFNETKEALERQTATADILKVISGSPTDVQPVFDEIARSAQRLFAARYAVVARRIGDMLHLAGHTAMGDAGDESLKKLYPARLTGEGALGKAVLSGQPAWVADVDAEAAYSAAFREGARQRGYRSLLAVPMIREGSSIGGIVVTRREAGPFTERQVNLLQTFADQAVIAIDNVRLFNETKEALEQQTATSEVLKTISRSTFDLNAVLQVLIENATRLAGATQGFIFRFDGQVARLAFSYNAPPAYTALIEANPIPPGRGTLVARTLLERRPVHIPDVLADPDFTWHEAQRLGRFRSMLGVPMLREGNLIGVIAMWSEVVKPFNDKQIELVSTFADQAVIAIENVRLFNETKEALEQQTATSEILKVISSSTTDVQPVFEAIVQSGLKLFPDAAVVATLPEGDQVRLAAIANLDPGFEEQWRRRFPFPLSREYLHGVALLDRRMVDVPDAATNTDPGLAPGIANFLASGYRGITIMPMVRGDAAVGTVTVARVNPGPLSNKQIALLRTFADQAVIAIENVRLFNETKEALEQQKASAEVLRVISNSVADTEPVFEVILRSCEELFAGLIVGINTVGDDGKVHIAAYHGHGREEMERHFPVPLSEASGSGAAIVRRAVVHYPDVDAADVPEYARRGARIAGSKSVIFAPMLWEDRAIGAIFVGRDFAGPFSEKDIALLKTFADQAVIAIQNARLFREIQEKSAQLEIANKHKSDFLANMSHELRTPLNAIIGFSEVLSERMFGEVNEKQAEYLKDIHESGRHLLSLINDILDLSKIEAGRMELELSSFHLPSAVSNAMTLVRERAQRHGIALGSEIDPAVGEFEGDERKVKQILLNLLSNAVKFTPDGGKVHVLARKMNGKVEIEVRDTGIGIAAEDHAAVFEEFKQVGRDYTRKAEGTGLGLALTKRLVELHGGEIALESAPGKGSTFTVKLPLR